MNADAPFDRNRTNLLIYSQNSDLLLDNELADSAICTIQLINPPLDDFIRPEDLKSKNIVRHNLKIGSPLGFPEGKDEESPNFTDRVLPHSPLTQF